MIVALEEAKRKLTELTTMSSAHGTETMAKSLLTLMYIPHTKKNFTTVARQPVRIRLFAISVILLTVKQMIQNM